MVEEALRSLLLIVFEIGFSILKIGSTIDRLNSPDEKVFGSFIALVMMKRARRLKLKRKKSMNSIQSLDDDFGLGEEKP